MMSWSGGVRLRLENLPITPRARLLSASQDELRLAVDGLVCGVCAGRVQSALAQLPGVASAECSLETGEARVRLERADTDWANTNWTGAVESTVILPGARRWLTRLWQGAQRG